MLDLSSEQQAAISVADFFDGYVDARRGEIKSHHQVELTLNRMQSMLPDVPIGRLRKIDIARYVAARREKGIANGTINCELLTLSAAINYVCKRWGWDIPNPVPGQYLRWPSGRLRYLNRQEKQQLFSAAGQVRKRGAHVLSDFLSMAVNTGMRKNEMLGLTWSRVRFEESSIILTADDTKNACPRNLPLNKKARAALKSRQKWNQRYCKTSPWVFAERSGEQVKSIYPAFWEALKLAEIEDFRIHDLRHTFASSLVMKGVSLYVVRDLLGHSSIKMTERYAHLAQPALVSAVAALDD